MTFPRKIKQIRDIGLPLTVSAVGRLLGFHRNTVSAMLRDGRLGGLLIGDVLLYVSKGDRLN